MEIKKNLEEIIDHHLKSEIHDAAVKLEVVRVFLSISLDNSVHFGHGKWNIVTSHDNF